MSFTLLPLAPHRKVAKALPVAMLATKNLLVSVDAVADLELLATALADKHMATELPNCVLVRRSQRLKSFVTDITGGTLPLSCVLCTPNLIPSSKNMNPLHKPAFHIFMSR